MNVSSFIQGMTAKLSSYLNRPSPRGDYVGYDIIEFFKTPKGDSIVYLMTYTFDDHDWSHPDWTSWLRSLRDHNVTVRVIGGPIDKVPEALEKLVREDVVQARVIQESLTTHANFSTDPQKLMVEMHHRGGRPIDCYFTPNPHPDVLADAQKEYDRLWNSGKDLTYNKGGF